jgi:CheY-like chemotaxis protein
MLQNRTILVVVHSEPDRNMIAETLKQLGFECVCFENIYKLISEIDNFDQSLCLLDTELPGIVGIDAAISLKKRLERSGKNHIYIALSQYGDDFDVIATKSGFDGYLHIPVLKTELQACLSRYFSVNAGNNAEMKSEFVNTNSGEKLYSLDMFEEDEPDFIRSIVEIFVLNTPETLEAINEAFNKNDLDEVRQLAHKIKPHFGFFGATGLQKTMQMIEDIGIGTGNKSDFPELIESAREKSALIVAQLKSDLLS